MQAITHVASKLWARTTKHAVAVVAGICIVALSIASHDSLALHVSRRTLPTGAAQSVTTACAILLILVFWAVRAVSGTGLLGIAVANAGTANSTGRRKLTVSAAIFIGVVTDGVAPELASVGVAAVVLATTCRATTIALFVAFHDAVTTGLARNGSHVPVVGEAG